MTSIYNVSPERLLDFCELQCRSESALFPRDHIKRLYELAGHPMAGNLPEFIVVRPAIIDPLVAAARARLKGSI